MSVFCVNILSFHNFLGYHLLKYLLAFAHYIYIIILSKNTQYIFCSSTNSCSHALFLCFFLPPTIFCHNHFVMHIINRYHNTRMVNYDAHNGFSVSSTLLQPMDELQQQQQPSPPQHQHHEIQTAGSNAKQPPNATTATNKNAPLSKTKKPSYSLTSSISILQIKEVSLKHAGNITCAPSNAKQASITVHVLRGNINVHRKAIKHIFIAHSLLFSSSFSIRSFRFILFCSHPFPYPRRSSFIHFSAL